MMKDESEDKSSPWITLGIILRGDPKVLEDLVDDFYRREGVLVVFTKTSHQKLHLEEAPF